MEEKIEFKEKDDGQRYTCYGCNYPCTCILPKESMRTPHCCLYDRGFITDWRLGSDKNGEYIFIDESGLLIVDEPEPAEPDIVCDLGETPGLAEEQYRIYIDRRIGDGR